MNNKGRNAAYLSDLQHVIHRKAQLTMEADGFHVLVPCDACHKQVEAFHMRNKLPTDQIRKKIVNAGWMLNGGKHAECPNHFSITAPKRKVEPMPEFLHATKVDWHDEPVTPTERTKAAKREALTWLEEAFNVERGNYKAGVDDASIAKETGLSEEAVKALREDFYGPLKVPSELETLRSEVAAKLTLVDRLETDLKRHAETECELMRQQIGTLGSRLEAVITKGGWQE